MKYRVNVIQHSVTVVHVEADSEEAAESAALSKWLDGEYSEEHDDLTTEVFSEETEDEDG